MPLVPAIGRQRQADLCEFEGQPGLEELVPGQSPKLQRMSQKKKNPNK